MNTLLSKPPINLRNGVTLFSSPPHTHAIRTQFPLTMPTDSDQHHLFAPALKGARYSTLYRIRREASSMTPVAVNWLCSHVPSMLPLATADTVSILSIGAGSGDIDVPLLTAVLAAAPKSITVRYTGLEPLNEHRATLSAHLDTLASTTSPTSAQLDASAVATPFEQFVPPSNTTYDIVLCAHVVTYFEPLASFLPSAVQLLNPSSGRLLIVHQTATGVPEIQEEVLDDVKGNLDGLLTASKIEDNLRELDMRFVREDLDAYLELPGFGGDGEKDKDMEKDENEDSALALGIMSFCLECDLEKLAADDPRVRLVRRAFAKRVVQNKLYEPIAMFDVRGA